MGLDFIVMCFSPMTALSPSLGTYPIFVDVSSFYTIYI